MVKQKELSGLNVDNLSIQSLGIVPSFIRQDRNINLDESLVILDIDGAHLTATMYPASYYNENKVHYFVVKQGVLDIHFSDGSLADITLNAGDSIQIIAIANEGFFKFQGGGGGGTPTPPDANVFLSVKGNQYDSLVDGYAAFLTPEGVGIHKLQAIGDQSVIEHGNGHIMHAAIGRGDWNSSYASFWFLNGRYPSSVYYDPNAQSINYIQGNTFSGNPAPIKDLFLLSKYNVGAIWVDTSTNTAYFHTINRQGSDTTLHNGEPIDTATLGARAYNLNDNATIAVLISDTNIKSYRLRHGSNGHIFEKTKLLDVNLSGIIDALPIRDDYIIVQLNDKFYKLDYNGALSDFATAKEARRGLMRLTKDGFALIEDRGVFLYRYNGEKIQLLETNNYNVFDIITTDDIIILAVGSTTDSTVVMHYFIKECDPSDLKERWVGVEMPGITSSGNTQEIALAYTNADFVKLFALDTNNDLYTRDYFVGELIGIIADSSDTNNVSILNRGTLENNITNRWVGEQEYFLADGKLSIIKTNNKLGYRWAILKGRIFRI